MFNIDMLFLEWMTSFEGSVLTTFFKLVSSLANETLYLVIISFLYWCVSKRKAFYMIVMLCFFWIYRDSDKRIYENSTTVYIRWNSIFI